MQYFTNMGIHLNPLMKMKYTIYWPKQLWLKYQQMIAWGVMILYNRLMFEGFVKERLAEGKISVWDKMTRKTYNFQNCQCNSRTECIGTYQFGVVPRFIFAADGSLLIRLPYTTSSSWKVTTNNVNKLLGTRQQKLIHFVIKQLKHPWSWQTILNSIHIVYIY